MSCTVHNAYTILKKKILFIFREGEGREKDRERNINVWLPLACPPLGTWPTTQACALTWIRTCDPLVHRPAINPLNHTSQGHVLYFYMTCSTVGLFIPASSEIQK